MTKEPEHAAEPDERVQAEQLATALVREYYEDAKAEVQLLAVEHQGLERRPVYVFVGFGPTITERKRVRVSRLLGQLWDVAFAD